MIRISLPQSGEQRKIGFSSSPCRTISVRNYVEKRTCEFSGQPFRIADIPWTMGAGLAEIGFALESSTSSASTKILFCNICHLPITDLKDSSIQIQSSRRVHLECHQRDAIAKERARLKS
jgi:hypothetical protein